MKICRPCPFPGRPFSEDSRIVIRGIEHFACLAEQSVGLGQDVDDFQAGLVPPFRSGEGFLFGGVETVEGIAEVFE